MRLAEGFCRKHVTGFLVFSVCLIAMSPSATLSKEASPLPGQRVILVTGSTGGLGRETALALARAGDHVIIHGRNAERAQEVIQQIEEDGRGSARFYQADLASLEVTQELANAILADYQRLAVLIAQIEKSGIRRDGKRRFVEAKIIVVHRIFR